MRRLTIAAISLALLSGCSSTKVNSQAAGLVPEIQPSISQVSTSTQMVTSTPVGQWINLGNNGVVSISYQATASTPQDHSFWMRADFNQILADGTRTQHLLQAPQCSQGIYYSRYLIKANSSGQIIGQGVPNDAATAVVVDPDSLAGEAFKIACSTR